MDEIRAFYSVITGEKKFIKQSSGGMVEGTIAVKLKKKNKEEIIKNNLGTLAH